MKKFIVPIQFLYETCGKHSGENYYVGDAIPKSKLANAQKSLNCKLGEKVLALADFTFWGGADDALIITTNGIYSKNLFESTQYLDWHCLFGYNVFEKDGKIIQIGDRYKIDCTGVSSETFKQVLLPLLTSILAQIKMKDDDIEEQEDAQSAPKRPLILTCGLSGSGKTSLLQGFFGKSIVPDEKIGDGKPATQGFEYYEGKDLRVYDSRGLETSSNNYDFVGKLKHFVECNQSDPDIENHIHISWYVIPGCGARVSAGDLEIIKALPCPIVVLTKSDVAKTKQIHEMVGALEAHGIDSNDIVQTGCMTMNADNQNPDMLKMLHKRTLEKLPEAFRKAFQKYSEHLMDARRERQNEASKESEGYIKWAAGRAFAIAIVPIPIADVAPLVANEAYMIKRIGSAYGYGITDTVIVAFLGMLGASVGGKMLVSFIPFFKAPLAAGITYAVGCAAHAWFKSGMEMPREELMKIFNNAKKEAKKKSREFAEANAKEA